MRKEAFQSLLRIEPKEQGSARCLAAIDGAEPHSWRVAIDHAVVARLLMAVPRLRRLATAESFDGLEYADKSGFWSVWLRFGPGSQHAPGSAAACGLAPQSPITRATPISTRGLLADLARFDAARPGMAS